MPRIIAAQAAERSTTVASAIRIAEPVHAAEVDEAVRRSEGAVVTVSDTEILEAWGELAHLEGVFCEASSAGGLAALGLDRLEPGARVVCVITGHGLKDPETVARTAPEPIAVDPDPDAIAEAAA